MTCYTYTCATYTHAKRVARNHGLWTCITKHALFTTFCRALPCDTVCCSVLQFVAVRYVVMQYVAIFDIQSSPRPTRHQLKGHELASATLKSKCMNATSTHSRDAASKKLCHAMSHRHTSRALVAVCCSVLQCVAVWCGVVQCVCVRV